MISADRLGGAPRLVVLDDLPALGLSLVGRLVLAVGAVVVVVPVRLGVDAGVGGSGRLPAVGLDPYGVSRAAAVLFGVELLAVSVGEGIEGTGHGEGPGAVALGPLIQGRDAGGFVLGDELLVLGLSFPVLADAGGDVQQAVGILDGGFG
jgi:hypothetical protein